MLNDINFTVPKGTFAGIIGPNGSGKTTLFRGITGEIPLRSGSVTLNEKPLDKLSIRDKARNFAIVSQTTESLNIKVEDYVLMGRMPYRSYFKFLENAEDYEIAHKYMKLTSVFEYKDKLMSELSGGEQQLASVARALTQEPQFLLLDEPTSHLDISHQVQILNLIQKLNEELHLTVLMIIHDLNLASEYCNYLIMLNKGSIYIQGSPSEVLTYKNIEEVYETVVISLTNPLSLKPAVFLVSGKTLNDKKL